MGRPKGSKNKAKVTTTGDVITGGVPAPVRVAAKPAQLAGMELPKRYTDEGIAEYNVGKQKSIVEVVRDQWAAGLESRHNPFDEAANAYRAEHPDHAVRFINPNYQVDGRHRGWEVAADANGQQIKVGDEVLGFMPLEAKKARQRMLRERNNQLLAQNQAKLAEDTARFSRDSGGAVLGDPVNTYTNITKGQAG